MSWLLTSCFLCKSLTAHNCLFVGIVEYALIPTFVWCCKVFSLCISFPQKKTHEYKASSPCNILSVALYSISNAWDAWFASTIHIFKHAWWPSILGSNVRRLFAYCFLSWVSACLATLNVLLHSSSTVPCGQLVPEHTGVEAHNQSPSNFPAGPDIHRQQAHHGQHGQQQDHCSVLLGCVHPGDRDQPGGFY